jgi:hypothetical protein
MLRSKQVIQGLKFVPWVSSARSRMHAWGVAASSRGLSTYSPPGHVDDFSRSPKEADLRAGWHKYINDNMQSLAADYPHFVNLAEDTASGEVLMDPVPITWNGFPRGIAKWYASEIDSMNKAEQSAETLQPITFIRRGVAGEGKYNSKTPYANGELHDPQAPPMLRRVIYDDSNRGQLGDLVLLSQRQQDEYCEWFVDRNVDGDIVRISYTAEGPEYWTHLARHDMELVTDLYKNHVNSSIRRDDLVWPYDVAAYNYDTRQWEIAFRKGQYNPENKWNTTHGVMHLTHRANTLSAEMVLAAQATVYWDSDLGDEVDAATMSAEQKMIGCGGYGGINRSSDPRIGYQVNGFARDGLSVTVADPVGLYMASIDVSGLRNAANEDASHLLKITRGNVSNANQTMILRAQIEAPAGQTLSGYTFDSRSLENGGQIAKNITMTLFGGGKQRPNIESREQPCQVKVCEHPNRPGFYALRDRQGRCYSSDDANFASFWNSRAPYSDVGERLDSLSQGDGVDADASPRVNERIEMDLPRGV